AQHRPVCVDRLIQALMSIDRDEMHIAPIVRVITAAVGCRDTVRRERVDSEVRRSIRDVVVMISRTWEKRNGAHGAGVVIEVFLLVIIVVSTWIYEVAGVNHERCLFGKDSLRNEALRVAERIAPSTVAEDEELKRSRTSCSEACVTGGADVQP